MGISILTLYRLFFITQSDVLHALMKDGRTMKIKQTPYFSNISSDKKVLTGISFDGENTHVLSLPFAFDLTPKKEITFLFGYYYYPCLSKNGKKMAIVEADLLKPRPQGELRLYQRKIKKWYLEKSFDAKMKPPFISSIDDSLYYIDNDSMLHRVRGDKNLILAENVQSFALANNQTKLAFFDGEQITVYSLLEDKKITSFPVQNVTALGFDASDNQVFYAISQGNICAIYAQNYIQNKTSLLTQTDDVVVFISG